MRINKFKKIGTNKYKIFFDNETLTIYEDVILKYNLLYKKDIDNDLLLEINKENYKYSIYDTALKYIGVRMRSANELKEYLIKKKFDIIDINNTINKLLDNRLLNDTSFCKSYINDKINLTNSGLDKIRQDLIKLGIENNVIDNELSKVDKELIINKLERIINKEIKLNNKLPLVKLNNKIINRCINLGYKYEDIIEILKGSNIVSNSDIESDYNKLYTKYNKKYESYKLREILKQKLYQKGYTIEEINNILENY